MCAPDSTDTSSPNNPKISSTTTVKEKEYHFVPSQDDSRWISFSTSSGAQAPPPIVPHTAMYSPQQHSVVPPATGYYYYPHSGMSSQPAQLQTPSLTTVMHNHLYGHSSSNPAVNYFFDVLDPGLSSNYQLAQHMASTSNNRTFLPGD
jgi:hypothetical protein